MSNRKYDYMILSDGSKEKILNYHFISGLANADHSDILFFTKSGTYLYRRDNMSELIDNKLRIVRNHFYKLRGGVRRIDVSDDSLWYLADNIDRIELITTAR